MVLPVDNHLDFGGVAELRNVLFQNLAATTSLTKAGMIGYATTDNHFYGHNGTAVKRILWSDDTEAIPTLATAPATPTTAQKWYDSATNDIKYYNGTTTKTLATTDMVSSMFRIRSTAFSAAAGSLPVVSDNNVTALAGVALAQGDTFLVSTGGTIAGIGGADILEAGDMLVLMDATAPTNAASWYAFQTNVSLPTNVVAFENVTVALTAGAAVTIDPTTLGVIHSVEIYDSTGLKRPFVEVVLVAGATSATATSLNALTGARAFCLGVV
jgi:hypothetical protein